MKIELCLEVQAYLDGELESGRRADLTSLCENDLEARALRDTLKHVRDAVRENEPEYRLTDTREFYWSQIQRRIAAEEKQEVQPVGLLSTWQRLFRWLVPVGGLAAVALLFTFSDRPQTGSVTYSKMPVSASSVEFRSEADGVTVHWIN